MATGGSLIGALRVTLGLDSANFEAGMKKARSTASRDASAIQKTLSGVSTAIAGITAAISVGTLTALVGRALDYAGSLGEVAQQLGVTTQQLQVYRYAAGQVGISQEEMDKSLSKLSKTIGEAVAGGKQQSTVFRELGIALKGANGDILTAGDAIPKIADALEKVKDPAIRARVETELFGRAGQKLDTLLSGGSGAIDNLRNAAQDLGIVLSEDQIQNADRTADKLTELKTVLEANIAGAVANNASAIYDFVNALERLVAKIPETITWLRKLNDDFNIAFYTSRQALPYLTPEARKEAQTQINNARGDKAIATIQDAWRKGNDAQRKALEPFIPDNVRAALGLGSSASTPRGGGGNTGLINVPRGGGGGSRRRGGGGGRSGDAEADRRARAERRYEDELDRIRADQLNTEAELTGSIKARYEANIARLDSEKSAFTRQVNGEKELNDKQKKELITAKDAEIEQEKKLEMQKYQADIAEEAYTRAKDLLDSQAEELQSQLDLATTVKERRDLEMKLLEIRKQQERADLQRVLDTAPTGSESYANAERRMGGLDSKYQGLAAGVAARNLTPWQQFEKDLKTTASQIDVEFEGIAVKGLQDFNDGLVDAIVNGKSIGDVFKSVIKQIEADVIHLALTMAENEIFGGGSGGKKGGFFSSLLSVFSSAGSSFGGGSGGHSFGGSPSEAVQGFANGGSFMVGGNPGIDRNVLSINGIPRARVSASERINVANDNVRSGSAIIQLVVGPGQMFEPTVRAISGDVSVQTVNSYTSAQSRVRRNTLT